jgi:hypothetical protein
MAADPDLQHGRITIEVQNGVVLLSGTVDAPQTRQTAGDTARHVDGVLDVCNDIHVNQPDGQPHDDATASTSDAFDEIARHLSEHLPPAGRTPRRAAKVTGGVLAALVLWAALCVLMVRYGPIGVAVTCAVAAITLHVAHGRRRRPRRTRNVRCSG